MAFVLLHTTWAMCPRQPTASWVFGPPAGTLRTQLTDLQAKIQTATAQGTEAYVSQLTIDHPEVDPAEAAADAQLAISSFVGALLESAPQR